MSAQTVLLPVFVLVGLTFGSCLMAGARRNALGQREDQGQGYRARTTKLARPRHPDRQLLQEPVRAADPVYIPDRDRHAAAPCDYLIVLLSWVFVVTRLVHAGIFVTPTT